MDETMRDMNIQKKKGLLIVIEHAQFCRICDSIRVRERLREGERENGMMMKQKKKKNRVLPPGAAAIAGNRQNKKGSYRPPGNENIKHGDDVRHVVTR